MQRRSSGRGRWRLARCSHKPRDDGSHQTLGGPGRILLQGLWREWGSMSCLVLELRDYISAVSGPPACGPLQKLSCEKPARTTLVLWADGPKQDRERHSGHCSANPCQHHPGHQPSLSVATTCPPAHIFPFLKQEPDGGMGRTAPMKSPLLFFPPPCCPKEMEFQAPSACAL